MAIIKVHKRSNPLVTLNKTIFQDKSLSLKAKGLLCYLLSLPENWKIRVNEVVTYFPDGKHAIYSGLKELRERGYVQYRRNRCEGGVFSEAEYDVFESPQPHPDFQDVDKNKTTGQALEGNSQSSSDDPHSGFPYVDIPYVDNQTLLNNKVTTIKNKTAARKAHHAAATFNFFVGQETKIGESLTEEQRKWLKVTLSDVVQHFPDQDAARLESEVMFTLLDAKSFTQAGDDFVKKLNTILKMIRSGRWITPRGLASKKEKQYQQEVDALQQQRLDYQLDCDQWIKMMELPHSTYSEQDLSPMQAIVDKSMADKEK